jgi:hypothetical protein
MAIRRCCCRKQGQWSHNKEMCHEEIHRCSRVDLTYCDPDAHPDCKRSPRVAVELLIREQRLLTTSRARERLCLRLKLHGGRLALARRLPPTARSISPMNRFVSLRCLIPTLGISDSSCPRLSRASTSYKPCNIKDVDGRDEPGHDDVDGS